ncbi:MAG: hypothetical protein Q8M08_09280 [Bacteroidales bacterium]|nr:hypothetical protein [Bacteroidales bacterium]
MKKIKLVLILLAICAVPLISLSDPPGPPGSGTAGSEQGGGQTPVGAPIDGGLGILLALGLGYGGKKLYNAHKAKHVSIAEPEN